MITAVDTSVLLDVFRPDPTFGPRSLASLRRCGDEGALVACGVVWAELAAFFPDSEGLVQAMRELEVAYDEFDLACALLAGTSWSAYRRRGGPRERVIADFLIGAHAKLQADRLLTRDVRFHRTYLPGLAVIDPSNTLET